MFKPKTKGLFVELSEFSVLAARTSGYKLPMVIEALEEFPLKPDQDMRELREFFEGFVDFKGASYFVSRCGVYPEGGFVRFYETEVPNRSKDPQFLPRILESELNIEAASNQVSFLDARSGAAVPLEDSLTRRFVICGAPDESFKREQGRLLDVGIYPERLELASVTTLGGVSDYARFSGIQSPILCFELNSASANIAIVNQGQVDVSRPVAFGLDHIFPLLQRELGLKDPESAKKLFYSNTFDFSEIGPKLLRRMTKELQATTGFYEVQTGQTISGLYVSILPKNLGWVAQAVADSLGLDILQPSVKGWLESLNIKFGEDVETLSLGSRWMGLFSLMGEYQLREEVELGEE